MLLGCAFYLLAEGKSIGKLGIAENVNADGVGPAEDVNAVEFQDYTRNKGVQAKTIKDNTNGKYCTLYLDCVKQHMRNCKTDQILTMLVADAKVCPNHDRVFCDMFSLPPDKLDYCGPSIFRAGDGNGKEFKIGNQESNEKCFKACKEEQKKGGKKENINGATFGVIGGKRAKQCYCKYGMTGWKGGKADWTSAKMRTVSEIHNKPAVWDEVEGEDEYTDEQEQEDEEEFESYETDEDEYEK